MSRAEQMNVLDHGSVILRNIAGPTRRDEIVSVYEGANKVHVRQYDADDVDPAQAARLSFEDGDFGAHNLPRSYEQEMKLNEYLLKNEHTSPFEMVQVWLEVKVPIFIDRQLVRHRTWRRNESSGRYIVLPDKWYIPDIVGGKAPDKKQGQADNLDLELQEQFKMELEAQCRKSYTLYQHYMTRGVAPEHSRMFLHLNHYVHWLGNVDLHNLFHFLRLRAHSHAQVEARMYAETIVELLRPHLPGLIGLFDKHCRKAA